MSENYNNDVFNKLIELTNETYQTFVKTLIWNQERTLELTKALVGQANTIQAEGKGLVDEYTGQLQGIQRMVQNLYQESVKTGVEMVNQYRAATNQSLTDINSRLDSLQQRIESAVKVPNGVA